VILVGIGSNLRSSEGSLPKENCLEALRRLSLKQVRIISTSSFFESEPIPDVRQPWYINLVIAVKTNMPPLILMGCLLAIELEMGRKRTFTNGPRVIDLDLLAYNNKILNDVGLIIPHPRMYERAFVLKPLAEIAPDWLHPSTGKHINQLIEDLKPNQIARAIR